MNDIVLSTPMLRKIFVWPESSRHVNVFRFRLRKHIDTALLEMIHVLKNEQTIKGRGFKPLFNPGTVSMFMQTWNNREQPNQE